MVNASLQKALGKIGGATALANSLGIHRQAVHQWSRPGRQIPAHHIVEIERLTGVPREELRPDLYVARQSADS